MFHSIKITTTKKKLFEAISTPAGLNSWWTAAASGEPAVGAIFQLHFEPDYDWAAVVTQYEENSHIEFTIGQSDADWEGTAVSFRIYECDSEIQLDFQHKGWREENDHYRTTNQCWFHYLTLLKRYLETNEILPYARRLPEGSF